MNEDWNNGSTERDYLIEAESGFFDAQKFALYPVDFLREFRAEMIEEGYQESELALRAIGRIFEFEDIVSNENIPVQDEYVQRIFLAHIGSEAWAMNLFPLLKKAGYTKGEVITYIALDDPEFTYEERLHERGLNVYLDKVYGK